jgi:integrase
MPGTVYKRGDIWWFSFYYKGKKLRQSAKTTKKREAENLLSYYLGQVARGEFTGFEREKSLTLAELLTLSLDEAEMRGLRDVYHMRFRAEHLKAFFKDAPIEAITEQAIARYVAHRRTQAIARSTINRELAVLRGALRLAKKRKLIKELPDVVRFPEDNVRMVFFNAADFAKFTAHLPDVLQDMVRFAYLTGWRKGQIATLQWSDIDGEVIRLTGETVKTKSVQVLALAGELAEIIQRRRAAQNGPWVFHRDGNLIRDFRSAWKAALKKAGVKDYHFHDFRRTATRNMALAGVPEKHIMQVTGHKTTAMLHRYNITVEQDTHNTLMRTQEFLQRAQSSHREQIGENVEKKVTDISP